MAETTRRLPGDVAYPEGWPSCGHSHCRQNWIDTGAHDVCVECGEGFEDLVARERGECDACAYPCPEGCGRPAHYTGGPCTYCWHRHYDRED